jgi:hypothetical protein
MSEIIINPVFNFPNVEEALAPLSAGTEATVCVILCDNTSFVLSPPHPTYTNGYGKAVVQLNAIELGGINGLYA